MAFKIDVADTPRQSFSLRLEGIDAVVSLQHSENLMCFLMNLSYGDFRVNGLRLVNSYNIINGYRNILPFGIQIYGAREPFFRDDFANGSSEFLFLTAEEVESL
jgi:hypothetical protein